MINSPLAGRVPENAMLVDVPKLITAYYTLLPDINVKEQRVAFGTSGHRGCSFSYSFNENHILAIAQAICLYRQKQAIDGPLFLGFDTHALSAPAFASTMEVLAANGIIVMIADNDEYTPTPVISHAILKYNKRRKAGLADGIIITPSHNPPNNGGIKYNPPHGGSAATSVTQWIETKANELLKHHLREVNRTLFEKALSASTTHRHDFITPYVVDLGNTIDMALIRDSKIRIGVDPLGGAGLHYWEPIAEHYNIDLTVVNKKVDPTFSFMTLDWDGLIRMDPSSPFAMQSLIGLKDQFDISFACDTDHDRHGVVTNSKGLLDSNHYLAVAANYLLCNRPLWPAQAAIGKTAVTSQMIDLIASKAGRPIYEVPVGFKYFAYGLLDSSLCFGCEESAGATFSRLNGSVWTTDKDGFVAALLSAEITAKEGQDPGLLYKAIEREFGESFYDRVEAKANSEEKEKLKTISSFQIQSKSLAGERIRFVLTTAPGNSAALGGVKVSTDKGWFALRPSGTEDIYKIYAESFISKKHLETIISEGQSLVNKILEQNNNNT